MKMLNKGEFEMNEALNQKLEEAKSKMGSSYVFHPDYQPKRHHSSLYKQSYTLMNFLVARGAITKGRV